MKISARNRNREVVAIALVDREDYERLSALPWHLSTKGYPHHSQVIDGSVYKLPMHRAVMGLSKGDERQVDHKSRNKLDNRRGNLRVVAAYTQAFNCNAVGGSSKYRGVSWHKRIGKWQAQCRALGTNYSLGYYKNEKKAAKVASNFQRAVDTVLFNGQPQSAQVEKIRAIFQKMRPGRPKGGSQ